MTIKARHLFFSIVLLLSLPSLSWAEELKVTPLNLPQGSNVGEITGNISNGVKIPMRWAEQSSVALVPATRFEQFDGPHVLYRITMPAASVIKVRLDPAAGKKMSLYALRQSAQPPHEVPPNVTSAISSEASYPIYANMGGGRRVQNQDKGYREVEFMSVNRPYSILIGVAGAEGESEGDYKLSISISSR